MLKYWKKTSEKIVEGLLFLSGTVSSLVVLLIVLFLFKEGLSVFNQSPIEEGYIIAVNSSNNIDRLDPHQIKDIYDGKIINWSEISGPDVAIAPFRFSDITDFTIEGQLADDFSNLSFVLDSIVAVNPGIIAFFPEKYIKSGFRGKTLEKSKLGVIEFLGGTQWFPTAEPAAQLGVLPLVLGTLWVSFGAILIALPLGLATAIYMAEIAHERVRGILKPVIELLAGIPSVVYGFFGLVVIVPMIKDLFGLPVGETGLAGSIILGIMALPTVITISEDALRNTPRIMREASLALGATRWQTIVRVVIPYSISGITAAAILGIGRAIGETMAVLMVTGNASVIPTTLLEPVRTIPATIAAELGEAPQGGVHFKALFALACILFIMTLIINLLVEYASSKSIRSKKN